MRDDLPDLMPEERALLQRFRDDESPAPAVAARVMRQLSARLDHASPVAPARPWALWLRAGGLSVAIAAAALLLIGGTARVLAPEVRNAAPAAAVDTAQTPAPTPTAAPTMPMPTPPAASAPTVAPAPTAEAASPIELAPSALETMRARGSRSGPRGARATEAAPAPVDAAAEIALVMTIRRERDARARLGLIERHRREFARGGLVQEIAVLEIETLCALGRRDEASTRADAFARAHPDSAYGAITRRGCAEPTR